MSTRKEYAKPSFNEVSEGIEREKLEKEIQKIKPLVEVSIEGHPEIAKGRILDWNIPRKLFTVRWSKISGDFERISDEHVGIRAFFKAPLFSTQVVFKTTTVRKLENGTYHYRVPSQLFNQQQRGSLRVPIHLGNAILSSHEGRFKIVNLSVGGARIKTTKGKALTQLTGCELNLDGRRLKTPEFIAQATYAGENEVGLRFSGINEGIKTGIKQFLIEALKVHYEKEW